MSKIDDLIQKLCPNGVEYRTLGTLCSIETGNLNANCSVEGGEYAFFTTAKEISRIDAYRWDTEALLVAGNANVGDVKHYIGKFDAYQRTYVLTQFDELMSVRFLYFVLSSTLKQYLEAKSNKAAMTYIVLDTLKGFRIPVPPLSVQEEIVRILDSFTSLEAELEAELEARKKQYEYYRNKLLSADGQGDSRVDDLIQKLCPDGVDYKSVIELFDLRNGYTPSKSNPAYWNGRGTIPWFRMEDIRANGGVLNHALQQIPEIAVKGGKLFPANSLLVATSATIGEHALVTVPHLSNQRFTSLALKPRYQHMIDMKYMYYYGFILDDWCRNNVTTSSFASVDMAGFKHFRVPIPALPVQEEIVRILDKFDSLVNDLSAGLPAEIVARRQQYEFYRDQLLTFKELAA